MSGPANQLGTAAEVRAWHAGQEAAASGKQAGPAQEDHRDHTTEVMAPFPGGQPSIAEQSATHGAPLPAVDRGQDDKRKYGG